MTSLDQLRLTFFDECSEALQQIEAGLTDIREGNGSDDIINAVFRSVHSVKGGAGIFGFEQLVHFAHAFETVLDAMRSGKLAPTSDILDVLLSSSDVLSDLVTMSRAGDEIPADYGSECLSSLEQIMGKEPSEDGDDSPAPADFDGLDFVPIPVAMDDADSHGEMHLTPLEYRVLERLARGEGMIVRQEQLIAEVWGPDRIDDTRSLRVCIKNLRAKLEPDPRRPKFLLTEAGLGYRLRAEEGAAGVTT